MACFLWFLLQEKRKWTDSLNRIVLSTLRLFLIQNVDLVLMWFLQRVRGAICFFFFCFSLSFIFSRQRRAFPFWCWKRIQCKTMGERNSHKRSAIQLELSFRLFCSSSRGCWCQVVCRWKRLLCWFVVGASGCTRGNSNHWLVHVPGNLSRTRALRPGCSVR